MPTSKPKAPMGHSTTAAKKKIFLIALRNHGTVKKAAEICGVDYQTPYAWRKADSRFKAQWEQMLEDMLDDIELLAYNKHAVHDPNFAKWMLAMRRPEKYHKTDETVHAGEIKIEIVERPNEEDK